MIHYTCDFCGQPIRRADLRFEVRIEVRVAHDPSAEIPSLPDLHEDEAWDFLEVFDEGDEPILDEDAYRVFQFDMCPDCQRAFLTDPLSRPRRVDLQHFEN
ncbi:MAG: hypothetical protein ACYTHM_01540 [Planctomycetota bacterium]